MASSAVPDWLLDAPKCTSLDIRAGARVFESFYVGPQNGFSAEQWRTLRAALPIDDLPLVEGQLLLASPDVALAPVVSYYSALIRAAESHGRMLDVSSFELSIKPWITADGSPLCRFPWLDTYHETKAVLSSLAAESDGTLVEDMDQHWEVLVLRRGDSVLIGERDWESDTPARTAEAPAKLVAELALRASADLDGLVERVEAALGRRIWRG